jgi:plastocyanin
MSTMHVVLRAGATVAFVAALSGAWNATPEASASIIAPAEAVVPSAAATVEVQMLGDQTGYRFAPATITIKRGDSVRWTLVSGPPHNVAFWADSVPKGAAAALGKAMPNTVGPLTGPYFVTAGQSYTVSFAGLPAGRYKYNCTPHLALGMTGVVIVK